VQRRIEIKVAAVFAICERLSNLISFGSRRANGENRFSFLSVQQLSDDDLIRLAAKEDMLFGGWSA
jgi:hypothetical protein